MSVSARFNVKRLSAVGLVLAFVLTSCGSSGSSSGGKTKNSALCFATQADKDAAIATAQADLDAANASDTSGASGGYRVPALRLSTDTTVPSTDSTSDTVVSPSDTTVPSSDTTVVDTAPNMAMLEQALADAQNEQLCDVVNASSNSDAAPFFNAPTDLAATVDTDGNVNLSWTAPAASNVEPVMYWVGWGTVVDGQHVEQYVVWTHAPNTTYSLGSWLWNLTGPGTLRFHIHAGTGPCVGEGSGDCLYGPDALVDVSFPASTDITQPQNTVPVDPTPPYFNAPTNLTAKAGADGSVALNWTAPEASNTDPYLIVVSFTDIDSGQEVGGWGVWTRGTNTSYDLGHWMFDGSNPVTTGYGAVRFKLYAGSAACVGAGPGECLYGPSASVDVNVLDPNSGSTATTQAPTETTIGTETTIASDTSNATGTTVPSSGGVVILEAPLSPIEILTETPVLVGNDVTSMVCDEGCIAAMFMAAGLDGGTVTINGVSASFGSKSLRFPIDSKNGTINAVVTSTDGKSALDVSTQFEHVVRKSPVAGSTVASTSTSSSSKMIYIYVLIALLILVAIGYKRRQKATETK